MYIQLRTMFSVHEGVAELSSRTSIIYLSRFLFFTNNFLEYIGSLDCWTIRLVYCMQGTQWSKNVGK